MEYGDAGSVATLPDCRSERHAYRDAVVHAGDIDDECFFQIRKTAQGAAEHRLVSFCFACIKVIGAEINQHVVGGTPCRAEPCFPRQFHGVAVIEIDMVRGGYQRQSGYCILRHAETESGERRQAGLPTVAEIENGISEHGGTRNPSLQSHSTRTGDSYKVAITTDTRSKTVRQLGFNAKPFAQIRANGDVQLGALVEGDILHVNSNARWCGEAAIVSVVMILAQSVSPVTFGGVHRGADHGN